MCDDNTKEDINRGPTMRQVIKVRYGSTASYDSCGQLPLPVDESIYNASPEKRPTEAYPPMASCDRNARDRIDSGSYRQTF